MKKTKTKTSTYYTISIVGDNGSYFSQEGYSKYYDRLSLERKNELPEGEEIYGYKQALEHIAELKEKVYEDKKTYAEKQFQINVVTKVKTEIIL